MTNQVTHYKYTDENRLESVRQNGTILMAALYDGNGDRVFMVDRYTNDYIEIIEYTKKPEKEEKEENQNKKETATGTNSDQTNSQSNTRNNTETSETPENTTDNDTQLVEDTSRQNKNNNNNSNNVDDSKVPAILKKLDTPEQVIFWYGFGQIIVNSLRLFGFNYSKELDEMFDATWDYVNKKNGDNALAKKNNNGKDKDTVTVGTVSNENAKVKEKVLLPYKVKDKELDEYKITSYINDVNSEYTQVLMEYGTDGEVSSVYEYGYQRNSYTTVEGKSYYQYDGRGSVSNLTSQSGESMVSYTYDVYGQASATSVSDNLYLYNAEKTDMGTGYQYLRARYYDSGVGSFTTQDSYSGNLNSPLTQNLYIYVQNNPLMYVDPSGYFFKEIFGAVAGVANSVASGVKGLVTGKGTSGFSSGWSSGWSAGSKVGQSWDNNIVYAFTSSKKTSLKQEEINNIINVGIGTANTAQEGFYAGKSNEEILKEIEEKKRKLCEEAKHIQNQEESVSENKVLNGIKDFGGEVLNSLGIVLGAPGNVIRNISVDIGNGDFANIPSGIWGGITGERQTSVLDLFMGEEDQLKLQKKNQIIYDALNAVTSLADPTIIIPAAKSLTAVKELKVGVTVAKGTSNAVKYSPVNPGPLSRDVAETFRSATYTETLLTEDTVFYRVYTKVDDKVGRYMTRDPQNGAMQSQIDLALNPDWGNSAQNVTKVVVPKGTAIYEGAAAPQTINGGAGQLLGGGNQVYIPEVNANWFK